MHVISNAFLSQAELTQVDRWQHGPLEIHFVSEQQIGDRPDITWFVTEWNRHQCGGLARGSECLEALQSKGLLPGTNPNLIIAPTRYGYSDLLGMLGSLLPDEILKEHCINRRPKSNFWLHPMSESIGLLSPAHLERYSHKQLCRLVNDHLKRLASIIPGAFEKWIWSRLARSSRYRIEDFAKESSVRILAGDTRFWMHRLYRLAIDLYESRPPTEHEAEHWRSLEELERQLDEEIPADQRASFRLTRPRVGGSLWEPDDPDDRDWITQLLIEGGTTIESLEPVVDVLLGSATHEDFSDRYSWVKEDFERSFHSKRAKVKVCLYEFIDECPVHDGADTPGYENILFRDLMAFYDESDRRIILALRQGKTRSDIAEELGHSGHAAVSRRVKRIESKMRRILQPGS